MYPWGDAPATNEPAAFAVGDRVFSEDTAGRVVSVDAEQATMGVVWSDGGGGVITYPLDATYLRKGMPWET